MGPREAWSIGLGILVLVLLATLLAGPMRDRVSPGDADRAVAALLAWR